MRKSKSITLIVPDGKKSCAIAEDNVRTGEVESRLRCAGRGVREEQGAKVRESARA